jgi:pyrimidine-nucleoside phosphorylase
LLEGGRGKKEDRIDHGVGLEFHRRIGDKVKVGEKLVTIQYNSGTKLAEAQNLIVSAFEIGDVAVPSPQLISRIIGG